MTRQHLLLGILAVLVVIALPYTLMAQALEREKQQADQTMAELAPLRNQAMAIKQREEGIADHDKALQALERRLITSDPFATIQSELADAARLSGASLGSLTLEGGQAVAALPGVVRYAASVQVSGSLQQFLRFLRLLEQHKILIELPDISLKRQPAPRDTKSAEVQVNMSLGFFGKGPR